MLTVRGVRHQLLTALVLMGMVSTFGAASELKVAKIFSDNMVLQRDMSDPVWGWANPGEKITVQFDGQEKSTIADSNGKWMVRLDPLAASCEPKILTIIGKTERQEFTNVVVGDVWLCSGQSNMASSFRYLGILDEIKDVDYPMIRLGGFGDKVNPIPTELIFPRNGWSICNTKNLQNYPCVPYYFAFYLWKELQVPIGVIQASEGSSSIEAWMPPESFATQEKFKSGLAEIEKVQKQYREYSNYSLDEKKRIAIEISQDKYGCVLKGRLLHEELTAELAEYFFRFSLLLKPACLYNYEIRPLIPFAIRGAIWYQGGTDATWHKNIIPDYALKQKALVESWRKLWGQGDFPFYFVQIAPCFKLSPDMPEFWLEQYKAAGDVKNSAMIATLDIGDVKDVHPKNKKDVGLRLALLALKNTYGRRNIVASGPVYKSMQIVDGKIMVAFDCVGGGLTTKDGKEPDSFEVAGDDERFYPARAAIVGEKIAVSSPDVAKPQHVRYAWSYVANPNLRNKEGLGTFPFNTAEPFFKQKSMEQRVIKK